MKVPWNAKSCVLLDGHRNWEPWTHAGQYSTLTSFAWNRPESTYCWLFEHPTGVYVIWNTKYNRPSKVYPDLETAKVAVEMAL